MRYVMSLLMIILIMSGCSLFQSHADYILKHRSEICANICSQPIDSETFTSSHDTSYTTINTEYLPKDSMSLLLYLYCDSNNQVLIKNSELLTSKNGSLLFQLANGKLTIQSLRDSLKLEHKTIHTTTRIRTTVTAKVPVNVFKDREVTPWYVWMALGASVIGNVMQFLTKKRL